MKNSAAVSRTPTAKRCPWPPVPLVGALAAAGFGACAQAALVITEIMPSGSSSDWFELTNTGSAVVDLTGFKMDDSSFSATFAVPMAGIGQIAPGESVLFTEASSTAAFTTSYGACLNNVRVGIYSGSGVGLGGSNDGVAVFDSQGAEQARQQYTGSATAKTSFYFATNNSAPAVSVNGSGGAAACANTDVASPGISDGAVTRPGAATATSATAVLPTGFTAGWSAPGTGGTPTGYVVEVSSDSFASIAKTLAVGNSTSVTVTGLTPNTTYQYRVRAVNTGGPGTNSNAQTITTLQGLATTLPDNAAYSSVIGDGHERGFAFSLSNAAGAVTPTATSSNQAVVPDANIQVTGTGPYLLQVSPTAVGKADITVTLSDGATTLTRTIHYAASANTAAGTAPRWYTGRSDGSTVIVHDANTLLVGDDEAPALDASGNAAQSGGGNAFSAYAPGASGLPLTPLSPDASLGLGTGKSGAECTNAGYTGIADCDADGEVDTEASFTANGTVYVAGSHSNSKKGKSRPDRWRFMALTASGSGAGTSLAVAGYYKWLREDLRTWDANGAATHGLGAHYFGIADSSAGAAGGDETSPKAPEAATLSGFSIEGMTTSPDDGAAWLGLRAPLVGAPGQPAVTADSATGRTHALIVSVTNYASLPDGTGGTKGRATFGAPIRLDLDGRGIREIRKNAANEYLIIAGPASGSGKDFALYSWDGSADATGLATRLRLRSANLGTFTKPATECAAEGIGAMPASLDAGGSVEIISDCGDANFYGDGTAAKDLPYAAWKKFRADTVALAGLTAQSITLTHLPGNPTLLGTAPVTVAATGGSSGNPVVLVASPATVCSVSGFTVRVTGTGTCTLRATQAGDGSHADGVQSYSFQVTMPTGSGTTLVGSGTYSGASGTVSGGAWQFASNSAGFQAVPGGTPSGYTFPHGMFDFALVSGTGPATVSLYLPTAAPAGAKLWKYGYQTPGATTRTWYEFPGSYSFSPDRMHVTFTLTDGAVGQDDDQQPNGIIIDPVAVGLAAIGPGTTASIPTLGEWARGLLVLALAGLAGLRLRKQVPRQRA